MQLIAFGSLKTPGLRLAADYYQKLLRPYGQFQEIELKPCKPTAEAFRSPSPAQQAASRKLIQSTEEKTLLTCLDKQPRGGKSHLLLLDEKGKTRSTLLWSKHFAQLQDQGTRNLRIVVGGSYGFSAELKAQVANELVSLGPQTLPHELARVVLIEQLYRSFSVLHQHPYHNEGE